MVSEKNLSDLDDVTSNEDDDDEEEEDDDDGGANKKFVFDKLWLI